MNGLSGVIFKLSWIIGGLAVSCGVFSADGVAREVKVVDLTGMQLRACLVAYEDFRPRGFLLENYTIRIAEFSGGLEITFVPEHPPGPTVRGGRTSYGQEIKYLMSMSGEIERISYAR